jgi:DNA-binding transcriptional LysR family regulator
MVAGSDWVTILPGVMMASDAARNSGPLKVNPLAGPRLDLDLVAIEPARRALSPAAAAFYGELEAETRRINRVWPHLTPSPSPAGVRRRRRAAA